ncbi:hypothetical protein [Sorangium cellulosum]|nr:hypothetical protein [Sorangium cellulosum]
MTCDEMADECGIETATGCYECALAGACDDARNACGDIPACVALVECLDDCPEAEDPAACPEACRTSAPEDAVAAHDALRKCVICDECPNNCGADDEPLCAAD